MVVNHPRSVVAFLLDERWISGGNIQVGVASLKLRVRTGKDASLKGKSSSTPILTFQVLLLLV